MAEIKNIIYQLCVYTNNLLNVNFKAEDFRVAKFNEGGIDVIQKFWNVLCKAVKYSGILPEHHVFHSNGDMVVAGKVYLAVLGYKSLPFYSLPPDMSYGSRELLLALGWLIAEKHILQLCFLNKIKESDLSMDMKTDDVEKQDETTLRKHHSSLSLMDMLKSLTWLSGKVRHDINSVANLNEQRIRAFNKVHSAVKSHESVLEIALPSEEIAINYCDKNKPVVELIKLHNQWTKNCSLFWKWMESVLIEREKSLFQPNVMYVFEFMSELKNKLQMYLKLQQTEINSDFVGNMHGMPRHILKPKDVHTDMGKWIADLDFLVKKTRQEYKEMKHEVNMKLITSLAKMETVSMTLSSLV